MKKIFLALLMIPLIVEGQNHIPVNFRKSKIKLDDTRFITYKGTVQVKLNRLDSASTNISLPVFIIKSPSESPLEPIYWMAGGPGSSNFSINPPKALLTRHDFVIVGYRGVDGYTLKKSKKLVKAMKGVNNRLLSDTSIENLGKCFEEYFADLIKDGSDINKFTIIDVIDDFEEAQRILGHEKINILSASYGTRVALLYSYRYPDAIKRTLMIGVNPPGHFVWYPEITTRIIRNYDSIYRTQFGNHTTSIEECIKKAFENMPKRWSFFKLDADKIKATSFFLLFSRRDAVMCFDAFRKAATKGDYSGLYLMQLAYDYVAKKMNYGDLFSKAFTADYNAETDYRKLFKPDNYSIGAPLSYLYWGSSKKGFGNLIPEQYRHPRISGMETLMISGNLDISTPYEFATELLSTLPNSKQIIFTDMSHVGDLVYNQYDAFVNLSLKFFDDGTVDTTMFKHTPINFNSKGSFNKMAKTFYPLIFVMSLIK